MPVGIRSMRKVPGTGLTLYESKEKTPTGLSNSFSSGGLTPDDLIEYARKYNLPTTSNREFQQAQYDMLMKTPEGRDAIKAMEAKYGKPRAGTYADNMLGARTLDMMMFRPKLPMGEPILLEKENLTPRQPLINISNDEVRLKPNPVVTPITTPLEQKLVNENEKHGRYVVKRPEWSAWGTPEAWGGLGGYDEQGHAPHWYNLVRQIQRGLDRRMLKKYQKENPGGTKYGGPMTDEQYYKWWKQTGNTGPAPKIGSVIEY